MRREATARHAYSAATLCFFLCVNWARFALLTSNKRMLRFSKSSKIARVTFDCERRACGSSGSLYCLFVCLFVCGCYGRRGLWQHLLLLLLLVSFVLFFRAPLPVSSGLPRARGFPLSSLFLTSYSCFVVCKLTLVRVCLFNVCMCVSRDVFFLRSSPGLICLSIVCFLNA